MPTIARTKTKKYRIRANRSFARQKHNLATLNQNYYEEARKTYQEYRKNLNSSSEETDNSIRPQQGPQTMFLSTSADIAVYGGAAGGGKTFALLLEPLRHVDNPRFTGVIFRESYPQIFNPGSLWDTSSELYPLAGGIPTTTAAKWTFKSGSYIVFRHFQDDRATSDWQGSQTPYQGWDELTHFCMHPDTDLLTSTGWKNITEIEIGDYVASYTKDRKLVYEVVKANPSFNFDGEMVCANDTRGLKFSVTPNHKMVVDRQDNNKTWQFKRADNLKYFETIPRTATWDCQNELTSYDFDKSLGRGCGSNCNDTASINGDDWLEFLGWYLSEGCAYRQNNGTGSPIVAVRQTKQNDSLDRLFARLPWRSNKTKDGQYIICSKQLYDELKPLGNTYTKRIPRWVFNLSKRQIQILWDSFVAGDGHKVKTGAIEFGLANEGLIDDLQELAVKLGLIANKSAHITKTGYQTYKLGVSNPNRAATACKTYRERYTGKVHCITVNNNHTFLARYRGRYFWTGNTEQQFFTVALSRGRSVSGVKPYVRATCNPDAKSWVKIFLAPWLDPHYSSTYTYNSIKYKFGPAAPGELRYFIRVNGEIKWVPANYRDEDGSGGVSVTFVPASVYDNRILLRKNPEYLQGLKSLPLVEQARLLYGDWNISEQGNMFRPDWFIPVSLEDIPKHLKLVRRWDLAASQKSKAKKEPDYTSSILLGMDDSTPIPKYYLLDMTLDQESPGTVAEIFKRVTRRDKVFWKKYASSYMVTMEQEPGSGGLNVIYDYEKIAAKLNIRFEGKKSTGAMGSKQDRAKPFSRECQAGNVFILNADWNEHWFAFSSPFPDKRVKDDPVDAASGAYSDFNEMIDGACPVDPVDRYQSIGSTRFSTYDDIISADYSIEHKRSYGDYQRFMKDQERREKTIFSESAFERYGR